MLQILGDNDIHIYLPEERECHVEVLSPHVFCQGGPKAVFLANTKRSVFRA